MAYEAYRDDDRDFETARADANNTNTIRNAADVAIASKNPYAMAAGAAVKTADKFTDGKASEALGRGMTKVNRYSPGGNQVQNLSNNLSESGLGDKIGQAAAMKNQIDARNGNNSGGEQGSLPSSNVQNSPQISSGGSNADLNDKKDNNDKNDENGDSKGSTSLEGTRVSPIVKAVIISLLPVIFIIVILFMVIANAIGLVSDYEDAFGISQTTGEETGGFYFTASSDEQQKFYDRVNEVKLNFQASGKDLDPLKVVAIYHVLNANGADLEYKDMTTIRITTFANAMLYNNTYNEDTFKYNLINDIIPKYVPNASKIEREQIADDILSYVDRYNSLVGKNIGGINGGAQFSCASSGSCTYNVKGFYIQGKGNVSSNLDISDLYVRLMQCGSGNGHDYGGTFGLPLEGEDLVPFEKYILGVAYQEIGLADEHAFKAQLVAARSYILARHVDMGGWRTLKQESNGKWVLQAAACTQDQVYCDPDKGCSTPGDGQWSQVYSGLGHGKVLKSPLPDDSPYRRYAAQVAGEVLTNTQGYIVYSGYMQNEQNKFIELAKAGNNYKQILMTVYNQGSRNYGASNISRNSCSGSGPGCVSNGDYAGWKQCGAPWSNVAMGTSGRNICNIGCLVTSISMLIAKSGVQTNIADFNPGTFVEFLNANGGFYSGGNFVYAGATKAAPSFVYQGQVSVSGMTKQQKLDKIKSLVNQAGVYVVAEVKGNTGQHWVAIDSVNGDVITMMDPGSNSTDMWSEYNWANTSTLVYYRVN